MKPSKVMSTTSYDEVSTSQHGDLMAEGSVICFRVSKELHESLAQAAKEERRSLSSTIEKILTNYIKEKKVFQRAENERRKYRRRALTVPAVIHQREREQIGIGSITDISMGGAKVLILKDSKHQILIDSKGSRFEVVFNLPAENRPIRMSCESMSVADAEDSIHVGASFLGTDLKSYKTLQTYLM
jgi:hypothetical protein